MDKTITRSNWSVEEKIIELGGIAVLDSYRLGWILFEWRNPAETENPIPR